jgi:hypothetical protein
MAMVTVRLVRVEAGETARISISRGNGGKSQTVGDLLREQISAVGDAPIQRDSSKIRATLTFLLKPYRKSRSHWARNTIQRSEQTVISSHGTNL